MATWLDAIMSPLNAAGEGIQKLIETRDLVKFGDALGKVYAQVLSAQQGALAANAREFALTEEIRELKKRVGELETFSAEMEKYELVSLSPGVVALALKQGVRSEKPAHYLCADCAANGKRYYLQAHISGPYLDRFKCGGCGFEVDIHKGNPPPEVWGLT